MADPNPGLNIGKPLRSQSHVSRRRRKLQLAIDDERPHGPDNRAFRRRVRLPTEKEAN